MNLHTLPNGVRVLTVPSDSTGMVSVSVFVNAGSANELPEENGISHFLEHMAFKGTKRRSYNKISSDAERLGAEMNAFTDRTMTAYYIRGLSEHATTFVDILGDIFCNSVFDPEEIEKEREVILQEYRMYADKPSYVAHDAATELSYPKQAFGRKILGEPKNIQSFQREDFLAYIRKHYVGGNVIVGVAGKFDEDAVTAAIEKAFAKVATGTAANYTKRPTPTFVGGKTIKKKSVEQCAVNITFEGVGELDVSSAAYNVAVGALADGMSSPLFDEIREKRGLVYSVHGGVDARESSGVVTITAGTTADKLVEFFTATKELLQEASGGNRLKAIDIERAKNTICVEWASAQERPFSMLMNYVSRLFANGSKLNVEEELQQVRDVTKAEVKKALKNILAAKKSVVVVGKNVDPAVLEAF